MRASNRSRPRPVRALATLTIAMLIAATGCVGRAPAVDRNDAAITEDVRARLAADGQTNITVATTAGVVNVAGSVDKSADRDSVERIARETPGVRSVDNDVRFGGVPVPVGGSSR